MQRSYIHPENMMHGAFYASKGMVYKKYLVDGQFRIDPSELDLPNGKSFVLAAQICEVTLLTSMVGDMLDIF